MDPRPDRNASLKLITIALAVYIAWVAATYLLEGRINLLQRVDPVGRITYVAIANIAIGTILTTLAIRHLMKAGLVLPAKLGLDTANLRVAVVIGSALVGSLALFILQNPRTLEPTVVFNVFMQALPVSIAEVMVCWALVGSSFESTIRRNKITSVLGGAVTASVLFAVYHYAHSAPFNQTGVVLFLLLPSIATAVTYFLGRNVYAAIIVQNFLGIFGILASLPTLEPYRQPMVPIYALSAVSIAVVVISVSVILKRTAERIWVARKRLDGSEGHTAASDSSERRSEVR